MTDNILCVTGASGDTGMCLIRMVADRYDRILCHYRSGEDRIAALREEYGEKIVPIRADFADEASTRRFAEQILAEGLAPGHFVHLASSGASINVRFRKTEWADFQRELDITFRSGVILSQAFAPVMAGRGGGKIVFMLSEQVVWKPAKPYCAAYLCAKHALLGLMEGLAAEYAPRHVSVNAVSPSVMDTKFLQVPELVKELSIRSSPWKRLLTPEDVAPAFAFLLSPAADAITGQNIPVTAGS